MPEQMEILLDSLRTFWVQLSAFLPQLIGALVILFVGWLIAKLVRRIIIKILQVARVDLIAEKAGIEGFLAQAGGKLTISSIIGNILYWFIMFAVILSVFNTLNLTIAAELLNKIILYIPNVLVAVIVLVTSTQGPLPVVAN